MYIVECIKDNRIFSTETFDTLEKALKCRKRSHQLFINDNGVEVRVYEVEGNKFLEQ